MRGVIGRNLEHLVARQMEARQALERAAAEPHVAAVKAPLETAAASYITISRQYGTGGSVIARTVAERLSWSLYDRELLEAVATDAHLQQRLLEPFDETSRDDMEYWIRGLLTEETVSEHHYTASLFKVLASIAKVGQAVIVGRGAHLALPPDSGLRVRLFAPLEDRVAAICAEEGLTESEAIRKVNEVEQRRQLWLERAFGDAAKEKFTFDLALNTATLTIEGCVDLILAARGARPQAARQ
jgi:cytidylate kinase